MKLNTKFLFNYWKTIAFPGTSVLRSNRELLPGEWVTVTLARDLREARLSVDGEPVVTQRIHGSSKPLNLQTPLYIGGYDTQKIRLAPGMNVDQGFTGCISEVLIVLICSLPKNYSPNNYPFYFTPKKNYLTP